MSWIRIILSILTLLTCAVALTACQEGGGSDDFEWQPLYGDGGHDGTPVVARVGDIEITQKQLDLRYDELPRQHKARYEGESGLRLLLREMTNEALLVMGAVDEELYNMQEVRRTLISTRRTALSRAMRGLSIVADKEPTEEQMQEYFRLNRSKYEVKGRVNLRHVECLTRADANAAFERLKRGEETGDRNDDFAHVAVDYSVNEKTRANEGILGWVNEGSYVPYIPDSTEFTRIAFNLPMGINLPVEVGGRWHVIQVETKEEDRPMTYQEARATLKNHMMAGFQDELTTEWLAAARERHGVSYHGRFAPAGGISAEQLFARAMTVPGHLEKYDLFMTIQQEYPDSDRADDALFWGAQSAMDAFQDPVLAVNLLHQLITNYPDSEFVEDARYIVDNAHDEKVWNPVPEVSGD